MDLRVYTRSPVKGVFVALILVYCGLRIKAATIRSAYRARVELSKSWFINWWPTLSSALARKGMRFVTGMVTVITAARLI